MENHHEDLEDLKDLEVLEDLVDHLVDHHHYLVEEDHHHHLAEEDHHHHLVEADPHHHPEEEEDHHHHYHLLEDPLNQGPTSPWKFWKPTSFSTSFRGIIYTHLSIRIRSYWSTNSL